MSYSEKDGQVVLTMSREDYDLILLLLGVGADTFGMQRMIGLANRLNEGNPDYTPYVISPAPHCKSSAPLR